MNFSIGSIKWPASDSEALFEYLGFLVLSAEKLGVVFPADKLNPISLAKGYIQGAVSMGQMSSAAEIWWDKINTEEGLRDFHGREALLARVALCFLSVKSFDSESLNEALSWYLQFLGRSGFNEGVAISLMKSYFKRG